MSLALLSIVGLAERIVDGVASYLYGTGTTAALVLVVACVTTTKLRRA